MHRGALRGTDALRHDFGPLALAAAILVLEFAGSKPALNVYLAARGSAVQRFVIGFGAGTSEMDTVVEGYAVTPQGWRKLGSGTLTSSGNKPRNGSSSRRSNCH